MLMERNCPRFLCKAYSDRLICIGKINPDPDDPESCDYKIQIEYRLTPTVKIICPKIKPKAAIHMYDNGSLCLYYPEDFRWTDKVNLHETIIPWTAEWLVFYERYLFSGKWEGPEAPHMVAFGRKQNS